MSKQTVSKKASKTSKQAQTSRKLLSKAERSAIARLAAFKAHTHKNFQADRTSAERKETVANYVREQKSFARQFPALA